MPGAAAVALLGANVRFWPTVLPDVRRELHRWQLHAWAIPDPVLRAHALDKLRRERFNAEVAATLATLVPRGARRDVIAAIVAVEVMYDYLDALTEQPVVDPLANGRSLYGAFEAALAFDHAPVERYRHHPQHDDGGYLAALAGTCRAALWSLPAAAAVAPVALGVAQRCGEAQTRTHASAQVGAGQLRAWARTLPAAGELHWWEAAAGAAASVLVLHALIASAADPDTTGADACRLVAAYTTTAALTTLLDSLVDARADAAAAAHAYIAYYDDEAQASERLGRLAREAAVAARALPHGPHHLMTVAGAVAFYLSEPGPDGERARRIARLAVAELQPLISPAMAIFRVWRQAKRAADGSVLGTPTSAGLHGRMKALEMGTMNVWRRVPAGRPEAPLEA